MSSGNELELGLDLFELTKILQKSNCISATKIRISVKFIIHGLFLKFSLISIVSKYYSVDSRTHHKENNSYKILKIMINICFDFLFSTLYFRLVQRNFK